MSPSKFVEPTPSMPYSPMLSMPLAAPFVSQQWSTTGSQALVMPPSNYGLGARTTVSQPQFSSKPTLKKVETKVVHTPTNNASTSSAKPVASSTQRHIPPHFVILVQSLQANRNSGERRTLRTDLSLQIANDGRTYERAGVTKFRSYLNLAVQEGIVELGGNDADAWVRLRPDWYNAIPTKPIPSEFVELVKALQAFRQEGIYKPVRSQVASQMSKGVYKKAGVSKWSQYADLAVSEGIVKLGVSDGQDWISLHSKWHHAVF
ncbi:hypothetical protein CPB83DRAFT_471711 [Crepidotus variabilis]|uniref:Uncharacterized protein n=1 Tax=Crepidotus variabilis TaxID=179855 RepID=A0A9P6ER31_9AGAR|nr:hypothetical protein CPB83DRAFT_471711 [Crepidotus variabilis]